MVFSHFGRGATEARINWDGRRQSAVYLRLAWPIGERKWSGKKIRLGERKRDWAWESEMIIQLWLIRELRKGEGTAFADERSC